MMVSRGVVVYSHPVSQGCFGHSLSSPLRGATAEFDGVAPQGRSLIQSYPDAGSRVVCAVDKMSPHDGSSQVGPSYV
jgi:hypothetical protein